MNYLLWWGVVLLIAFPTMYLLEWIVEKIVSRNTKGKR